MHTLPRLMVWVAFGVTFFAAAAHGEEDSLTFERDIRPILKAYCFDCHGATEKPEGDLDLRLRRFLVAGGESGAAIEPGRPDVSLLMQRVRDGEMPPGEKKLPADQIATLRRWIAAGALTARDEPERLDPGVAITPEERAFWSFQPIQRPAPPTVTPGDRARTPIDAFLIARLRDAGLSFSPDADKRTLVRRVAFDLTGLPPTTAEVDAFLGDNSENAYETMIDHFLASPHYGERWGRHWLDVAGYADTEGYTNSDADRPWAYKYRDYVIRSLNQDKPFDEFLQEQLAGDEMVSPPHTNLADEQIERLAATGFLRMAADGTGSGANDDAARNQTVADTLKIVSTSLLGLSVGCAQCHDHRYDPIPQRDYYQLRAIFEPALNWKAWRPPAQRLVSLYTDADRAKAAEVEAEAGKIAAARAEKQTTYLAEALELELKKYDESLREMLRAAYKTPADKRNSEQVALLKQYPSVNISPGVLYQYNQAAADDLKNYDEQIAKIRADKPVEEFVRALTEIPGQTPPTFFFHRGEFQQPTDEVAPAALTITAPPGERFQIAVDDEHLPTTGRRLAYARWLTNGKHPLVARVLINRVWMHHFERGIVGTPSDFGVLGERPTHPELLDWLASEFMAGGWRLKKLHKQILLSTAFRQSSQIASDGQVIDSANLLLWKMPVRRLDAEILRDRVLAVCGVLKDDLYGPPVNVKADDTGQVVVEGEDARRAIYIRVKRTQPVALLKAFDAPVMEVNCERRPSSTVATQSLMMMNSDFVLRHARLLADRVRAESAGEPEPELAPALALETSDQSPWSYGYGAYDEASGRTSAFQPLPHWTGSSWQGDAELPDARLGWVLVRAAGGHPGDDAHASIRRWTTRAAGVVTVTGSLEHGSDQGDGVRGRLVSSREGLVGEWLAHNQQVDTSSRSFAVQAGDTVDFVVDRRTNEGFDSYSWRVRLVWTSDGATRVWNSEPEFSGPPEATPSPARQAAYAWRLAFGRLITPGELESAVRFLAEQRDYCAHPPADNSAADVAALTNLCQALLSSNEFLYVD